MSNELLDLSSEVSKAGAGEARCAKNQMPEELDIFSEYGQPSGEVEELSLAEGLAEVQTATDSWPDMSDKELLDLSSEGTKEVKTSEDEKLDPMWDISASLDPDVASSSSQTPLDMLDMDSNMFASGQSTDDIEAILDELDATDFSQTEDLSDDLDLGPIDWEKDMELLGDRDPDEGSTGEQTSTACVPVFVRIALPGDTAAAKNNQWEELEALLGHEEQASLGDAEQAVFARLEEFLDASQDGLQAESTGNEETQSEAGNGSSNSDEFDELEAMLVDADKLGGPPIKPHSKQRQQQTHSRPRQPEQNMKVPIKQLDNLSNLVGELVVNRNRLEQNQYRLRTTLDNLLYQVQQLNDVGGRMQDLYERSLLEAALLNSRTGNRPGAQLKETAPSNNQHYTEEEFDVLEMVLRGAGEYIALQVDRVLGEQEIVIKQLEGPVPKPMGVAGATVLGDSRIMPIADVLELIDLSKGRSRRERTWDYDAMQTIPEVPQIKTEPTVLIVDDSITVRELLSMTFNKAGYRVEQARDGQDAWDKLRSGLPCDIIFCDIEMPRMDGLELLDRLQKDEHLNHMPMAMLTSRGADKHRQRAANSGAKGYFTKPYLEEALLEAAQRMLKGEVLIAATS